MAECTIVRVITRLNIGGPALHVSLLATRLDPQRFSTCLIVGESEPAEGDLSQAVESRVRLLRLNGLRRPIRPWADLASWIRLLRIFWAERPDIIHTHMAKAGALGRSAGMVYNAVGPGRRRGRRAVLIHTFHGHVLDGYFSPLLSRIFITIEQALASRTDCLIAVSPTIQRDLTAKGIGRAVQWRVIPLGLDLAALARLPLPPETPVVRMGLVGRLVPIKNPHLYLDAFRRLQGDGPGPLITGVIVGDGPLRRELEGLVRTWGLESSVQFTGWQRDLAAVYGGLDIVCLTSWNEGTPVALIEAMAAGRTVIATDVGGVRDVLDDAPQAVGVVEAGHSRLAPRGVLVRAGDAEALAAAIRMVAGDYGLRQRLAQAARAYVVQHFAAERLLHDMTALYEEMMARRNG